MANPQLVAYIKEHGAQFQKEQLVQTLGVAGWAAPDISEAFMELERPASPAQPLPAVVPVVAPPIQPPIVATPVAPTMPATTTPVDVGADFLAQMEKRRHEAAAATAAQSPYQQPATTPGASAPQHQQFTGGASAPAQKGIVGMLIQWKLAKDEQQANIMMIGMGVVCVGLCAWFLL